MIGRNLNHLITRASNCIGMKNLLNLGITGKTLEVFLSTTDFKSQTLMNTVPNDFKETASAQSSLSDLSQTTNPIAKMKNSSNVPILL